MNISSIGGADGSTAVGANQNDFRTKMQQSLGPVAQLFGMSTDQLMSAVKDSGKSLADYAASKGVSSTDLTAAIKQGLQAGAPNGVQLSDTQLTNLAQRIENHKPGDRPQGPPPSGQVGSATSSNSTSALKAEVEKLLEDLKANQSSSASTTGVSSSSSTSTMKTDLEKLLADLKASDADSASSSTASSSGSGSVSANALIDVLTRFDRQL